MSELDSNYRLIDFPSEFSPDEIHLFEDHLKQLVSNSGKPVLINCEDVDMMYSSGLSVLVSAYKVCNQLKIYFGVVNINKTVRSIIESAKLDDVFSIYNTLEEYEISEMDDGAVGTKVPPLDFSYEEIILRNQPLFVCKGVMNEGEVFNSMFRAASKSGIAIFDFKYLNFIDADCLEEFSRLCENTRTYIVHASEIVKDEFKLFEIENNIIIKDSLEEVELDISSQ